MKLIIAGAGGHGRVVADLAESRNGYAAIAFLDDLHPQLLHTGPWPVIGKLADCAAVRAEYGVLLVAIGDARTRLAVLDRALQMGFASPALVHPSAVVSRHASLGQGTVVCAGAVVGIGASLGRACIVNTGATVDHDCRLGDAVHVAPGAHLAGEVVVGDRTWIGIGASVRQQVSIGDNAVIGAGAVCVSDVRGGITVTGVPARETLAK